MASREEVGALVVSATLDAKQFQDGVSNIKRQLAVTKSEFKAASASLGSFGDATDMLKLKSDSLSEQIQMQNALVESLAGQFENLSNVEGENARATQGMAVKLNDAKTELFGMQDQLKIVNMELEQNATGMSAAGTATEKAAVEQKSFAASVEGTKKGLESTKLAMIGMMGVMAGGLLAEWSDGAEKMAISLQKLQIETGDSQPSLERLAVVASGAGVSTDQLATMIGKLDMRVSNATLGTKSFASGLNDLGISAQKFAEANLPEQASMIAEAVKNSTLPTKQLDSALKNIGISAQNLGAAAKGNIGVISGSLARASQEGSTLGRALAQAGIDMNTFAGADIETKLQMLGKHFEETKDKAKATALVMQVFGKSGQDMLPLIQNFAELDDYAKQLKMPVMDTKEIQLAAEKTKMLQTAMQMMIDSALVKVLPLVDKIAKSFYDLASNIDHPVQAVKDFVKEMGPVPAVITGAVAAFVGMKVITSLVGTMTAFKNSVIATGGALKTAALFTGLFGEAEGRTTIKTVAATIATKAQTVATKAQAAATKVAEIAQAAFNVVMEIGLLPIIAIIAAIAALAFGIYELVTHWKTVQAALSAGWNWLKNEATTIWNGITAFFKKWGVTLLAAFLPVIGLPILIALHWKQIVTVAQQIWGSVVKFVTGLWTGFVSWITGAAQAVADAVINAFKWMYDHNTYVKALVDDVVKLWTSCVTFVSGLWTGFVAFISGLWNGIVTAAQTIFNTFKAWFTDFWNAEKAGWTAIWNAISGAVKAVWNAIVTAAKAVWQPMADFFSGLWNGISGAASKAWNAIVGALTGLWNGAINTAKGIFNGLGTFFTGLWKDAMNWGGNLIHMFVQGIMSKVHEVEDAVKNVASTVSKFLGFHSPTEEGPGADADTWMPNLMNMMVEGVYKGTPKLQDALKKAIPSMDSTFTANIAGMNSARTANIVGGSAAGGLPNVAQSNVPNITIPIAINAPIYGVNDLENTMTRIMSNKVVPILKTLVRQPANQML